MNSSAPSAFPPLADRIRPTSVDDFIGQEHLVGPKGPIRKMLETGQLFSMIFWGPPGSGKTTLARIIARNVNADYHELSAVSAGKSDVKKIVEGVGSVPQQYASHFCGLRPLRRSYSEASPRVVVSQLRGSGVPTIFPLEKSGPSEKAQQTTLFLDEIHRFNKAQQDYLLPYVERGTITLIGSTTENPSFEVISPLLSRCRTYVFNELSDENLGQILDRGLDAIKHSVDIDARKMLVQYANGDGRTVLNVVDLAAKLFPRKKTWDVEILQRVIQDKRLRYDTTGEEHYNTMSSYLKSMRASNVDAALYYLARMVEAGEDPLFIARRMVVFASEDVASPTAIVVADAVFRACETVGYPECQENLAAGTVYLAKAPKDRSSYNAYMEALSDVKTYGNLPIPMNLRNAPTKLMKELGYGKGYDKYTKEDLLPDKLKGKMYYKFDKG